MLQNGQLWDPVVIWGLCLITQPWGTAVPITHPLSPLVARNTRVLSTLRKESYTRVDEPACFWSLGAEMCARSPFSEAGLGCGVNWMAREGAVPFPGCDAAECQQPWASEAGTPLTH